MKAIYNIILALAVVAGLLACTKDIEQPRLEGFDGASQRALSASKTDVVLDGYNEDAGALTLSWENYDLSVSNPEYSVPKENISSYIELSKTALFAPADTSLLVKGFEKTFTNKELNLIVSKLGYAKKVKASIYVRIRYVIGENIDPQYSTPLELMVTPYGIILDRMDVLATDKQKVVGKLYSPTENGIYEGYVAATGDWMNFYLQDKEENIWGCVPDNAYNMTSDQDNMWNFWLQSMAGCWRVTADVNTLTWGSAQITSMKLTGTSGKSREMKFDRKANTWTAVVSTDGAESFKAEAANKQYSIDNKDGVDASPIVFDNLLTVNGAGNWTITLDMNGQTPSASYAKSEEGEQASYPDALIMINNDDWNVVNCRLYSTSHDGTYLGFYRTVKGWENFWLATEGKETIWGCAPGAQFTLDSSDQHWNLWGDEYVGLKRYWVSLADETWSETNIQKISVAGSIDGGNMEMSYDAASKTWNADIKVSDPDGWGVKILLNDDWGDVFVRKEDGVLGYNDGGDIKLPGTGAYRLSISLFDMEHLTYEFIAK